MSTPLLLVPIRVDGLNLPAAISVVGPPAFHRLPYVGTQTRRRLHARKRDGTLADVNASTPFLAESIHSPPMADADTILEAGVHLHWTLPRAIRTAAHPSPNGTLDETQLGFRRAPDRWLVRRLEGGVESHRWLIQSDYVWPARQGAPKASAIWPWQVTAAADGTLSFRAPTGEPPWRNVGKVVDATHGFPAASGAVLPDGLRANGWGDPTFAGYYPACRSVFGMRDKRTDATEGTTYEVYGWYSNPGDTDPGWGTVDPAGNLAGMDIHTAATWLSQNLGWALDATQPVPTRTLFVGRLTFADLTPCGVAWPNYQVAAAETASEALATLLAKGIATARFASESDARLVERVRLERHLNALLLEPALREDSVDIGLALQRARHRAGFRAEAAWPHRTTRPESKQASDAGSSPPSPELLQAVRDANAAVEAEWRCARELEQQQQWLFADWYRCVKVGLPPIAADADWALGDHQGGAVTADDLYRRLRVERIPAVDAAKAALDAATAVKQRALTAIGDLLKALPTVPAGGSPPTVRKGTQAPYYAPADPVVALLPTTSNTSDRWNESGLARNDHGDLLTAAAVAEFDAGTFAWVTTGEASGLPGAAAALLAKSDPTRVADEIHPFAMDWQVTYTPATLVEDDANGVTVASAGSAVDAIDLAGRSLVTQDAAGALRARIGAYIRARLEERAVGLPELDNTPLHPMVVALQAPAKMRRVSWKDVNGWSDPATVVAPLPQELRDWTAEFTATGRMLAAGAAVRGWSSTSDPCFGLDSSGALASGIVALLASHWGPNAPLVDWLTGFLQLPPELAHPLAAFVDPFARAGKGFNLADVLATLPFGQSEVLARLLQQADAEGHIWRATLAGGTAPPPSMNPEGVLGLAPALGLPRGGCVEAGLMALINTLSGEDLIDQLGLEPAVAAAVEVARELAEGHTLSGLAALARVQHWSAAATGALLRHAEAAAIWVVGTPPTAPGTDVMVAAVAVVEEVDPLRTAIDAWDALAGLPDAFVHRLDGLHERLLQWNSDPQFPVGNPMDFPDYQAFADRAVAPRLVGVRRRAPLVNSPLHVLRAGSLSGLQLRLIDAFGRPFDVQQGAVHIEAPVERATVPGQLSLPLRITQSARIRADWYTPLGTESPVLGWVVADNAAGAVVIYDATGEMLGSVDHAGRWRVAPGEFGPVLPSGVGEAHLRAFVEWLVPGDSDPAVGAADRVSTLIDAIDVALENIHPSETAADEAMAVLVSRPLALVRADVSIELRDPPAVRQDLATVLAATNDAGDTTSELAHRYVGVQIGEHGSLADGVVGFLLADPEGAVDGALRLPLQQTNRIVLPVAAAPQPVLLLLEPHARARFATQFAGGDGSLSPDGLLPARELRIHSHDWAPALARIDVRLAVGPLLTPDTGFAMPLPRLGVGSPSLLYLESGSWQEVGCDPQVSRAALAAAFPTDRGLWNRLVAAGVLLPFSGREEFARIVTPPPSTVAGQAVTLADLLATEPQVDAIVHYLQSAAVRLGSPTPAAEPSPQLVREGWIRLRQD